MMNHALSSLMRLLIDNLKASQTLTALNEKSGPAYENAKKAYDEAFERAQRLVFLWANSNTEFRDYIEQETGWKVPPIFDLIDPLELARNIQKTAKRYGL